MELISPGGRSGLGLVSVGVPVKNGAPQLRRALESVCGQTYQDLEILISDNASTDETQAICNEFIARDQRVRYRRHAEPVTALANFRSSFERSRGEYFMWAADDDWRSPNFVETLLSSLRADPSAVLAFSDVRLFRTPDAATHPSAYQLDFATRGMGLVDRIAKGTFGGVIAIYGLIRRSALEGYPWFEIEYGPDWVLMAWLAVQGEFIYAPGATFDYFLPEKSFQQQALDNFGRGLGPFPLDRCIWLCAKSAHLSGRRAGQRLGRLELLRALYATPRARLRARAYEGAPAWARAFWGLVRPIRDYVFKQR